MKSDSQKLELVRMHTRISVGLLKTEWSNDIVLEISQYFPSINDPRAKEIMEDMEKAISSSKSGEEVIEKMKEAGLQPRTSSTPSRKTT